MDILKVKVNDQWVGIPAIQGEAGEDGHSPVVTASKSGTVTTISVDGSAIATINDGPKGDKGDKGDTGNPGQDGSDGFSPTATVTKSGGVATITITDKNGTTTEQISDSPAVATIVETQAIITEYAG